MLFRIIAFTALLAACGNADDVPPVDDSGTEEEARELQNVDLLTADAASSFTIVDVAHRGNGCRKGTTNSMISSDGQAITVIFDDFQIAVNGDNRRTSRDSNSCAMELGIKAPKGWSYALFSAQLRGFVDLDPGVWAVHQTELRYRQNRVRASKSFKGEVMEDFLQDVTLKTRRLQWSPCDGRRQELSIKTSLSAQARRGAQGLMALDSVDGSFSQEFGVAWRKCPG